MAHMIVGDRELHLPEMNFVALERAWPFVEDVMANSDPMKAVAAGLHIVAASIMEGEGFSPIDFGIHPENVTGTSQEEKDDQIFKLLAYRLKKELKAAQIQHVTTAVLEICRDAGLEAAQQGEAKPSGEEQTLSPSTATSDPTSPNSLPQDAKEEAGTLSENDGLLSNMT